MILSVLRTVFGSPGYIVLTALVSMIVFVAATLLPNVSLLTVVFGTSGIGWDQKLALVASLMGSITTNFTFLSALATIITAVLLGINVSLVVYLLRRNLQRAQGSGVVLGALGALSGALGVGCAACGSLLFLNAAAVFGAASLLTLLPLKGAEFSIIGIALLILAIALMMREIARAPVCAIN